MRVYIVFQWLSIQSFKKVLTIYFHILGVITELWHVLIRLKPYSIFIKNQYKLQYKNIVIKATFSALRKILGIVFFYLVNPIAVNLP